MEHSNQDKLARGTVLIVDDSPVQRAFAGEVCLQLGFAGFVEAENGVDALGKLTATREHFTLALVDLEMPEMDGIELMQQMHLRDIQLPIVICSSRDATLIESVGHLVAALGVNVLGTVKKPLVPQVLETLLRAEGGFNILPRVPASAGTG